MTLFSQNKEYKKYIIAGFVVFIAVVLTLFNRWESSGESWIYWFFARIFAEGGGFIILDRSPLYILYLNVFHWIGYPYSVTIEYLITSFITVISIIVLFKRYLGLWLAVFAAILWLPYLQSSEPHVQSLALACSCFAIVARQSENRRVRFASSYALFVLSFMFRITYIIFIFVFLSWDIYKMIQRGGLNALAGTIRPQKADWPIMFVSGLFVWFVMTQSAHPWNNGWAAPTKWFPGGGKSLPAASVIQDYNTHYINAKYGTFEGHDFYFTNQQLFNGAADIKGSILANPKYVIEQLERNVTGIIPVAASLTSANLLFSSISVLSLRAPILLIFALTVIYGAFRSAKNESMTLFVVANLLTVGAFVIAVPRSRYMVPLVPILIMSAYWYGSQMQGFMQSTIKKILHPDNNNSGSDRRNWVSAILNLLAVPSFLILFSFGAIIWIVLIRNVLNDLQHEKIHVLESRSDSMKESFQSIIPLIQDCKGIMSLEYTFIGAFMNVPIDNIYAVFEIPPFGKLGDPDYNGLRPDRIDCLLVSNNLMTNPGQSTNYGIRYQNYIKPYAKHLQDIGATKYDLPQYGQAIIYIQNNGGM